MSLLPSVWTTVVMQAFDQKLSPVCNFSQQIARLQTNTKKLDHITHVLASLHWPVEILLEPVSRLLF